MRNEHYYRLKQGPDCLVVCDLTANNRKIKIIKTDVKISSDIIIRAGFLDGFLKENQLTSIEFIDGKVVLNNRFSSPTDPSKVNDAPDIDLGAINIEDPVTLNVNDLKRFSSVNENYLLSINDKLVIFNKYAIAYYNQDFKDSSVYYLKNDNIKCLKISDTIFSNGILVQDDLIQFDAFGVVQEYSKEANAHKFKSVKDFANEQFTDYIEFDFTQLKKWILTDMKNNEAKKRIDYNFTYKNGKLFNQFVEIDATSNVDEFSFNMLTVLFDELKNRKKVKMYFNNAFMKITDEFKDVLTPRQKPKQ